MQYDDLLEPNAMRDADTRNPANEAIQLSIAISLKRLADAFERAERNAGGSNAKS